MSGSALSASSRRSDLGTLARDKLDILVVGGGVVGAGIALDAATRGLSVGLVEAQDWASGSSSRSTKLIHGGLRYLEMFDLYLVREALRERGLLLEHLAPHLVSALPFLYPLRHRGYERAYAAVGISLYDALAHSRRRAVPRQRQLSRRRVYEESPGLRRGAFVGGIEFYDAQVDDARYVTTLVRTAASLGAIAANRTVALGLERERARVVGARLRDLETGDELIARARCVILATGVWTEQPAPETTEGRALSVRPSKGVHLVVPREAIAFSSALVTRTERSVLFVIPWGAHWIIGTTDTPWDHDRSRPVATASDIDYVLDHVNAILAEPLTLDDVVSVSAGLRPLVANSGEETTKVSREHAVATPSPGLVAVTGGKFTTYRVMAEDGVDAAVRDWPRAVGPSLTDSTPLLGADGVVSHRRDRDALAARYELAPGQIDHLTRRYGTLLEEVLAPGVADPGLLRPLGGSPLYLRAEVLYGVTHEGALHVEDVLRRRLRLDWETRDRGTASLDEVVSLMGDELGWTDNRRDTEGSYYRRLVASELEAQRHPDDAAASAVMAALPDPPWSHGSTVPVDLWGG